MTFHRPLKLVSLSNSALSLSQADFLAIHKDYSYLYGHHPGLQADGFPSPLSDNVLTPLSAPFQKSCLKKQTPLMGTSAGFNYS